MTQPAEVTSVWDWQRFETALGGLRAGVRVLDDFVAGIHEGRDHWRDDEQEEQPWTEAAPVPRRETELDHTDDRYLDGDPNPGVDD